MTERETRSGMSLAALRLVLKGDLACNQAPLDRLTVAVFRLGQYAITKPAPMRVAWSILDLVYTRLLIGAELPPQVRCGPRLTLLHAGRGVILHPGVRLGADVRIYHRVTIGIRGAPPPPVLGDRVYVGTGAAILGPVTVGDDARIGAGAVVTKDVPPGFTARGVPAVMVAPGMPAGAPDA
ncbi:MAG TPA: DapH/DapD/GlmU-related protein [Streptosporangiaceae bacterium]|nr:DapH/DapD/GlmU-related protein [Streptosporangiaceae bacterium]